MLDSVKIRVHFKLHHIGLPNIVLDELVNLDLNAHLSCEEWRKGTCGRLLTHSFTFSEFVQDWRSRAVYQWSTSPSSNSSSPPMKRQMRWFEVASSLIKRLNAPLSPRNGTGSGEIAIPDTKPLQSPGKHQDINPGHCVIISNRICL